MIIAFTNIAYIPQLLLHVVLLEARDSQHDSLFISPVSTLVHEL